MLVAVMAESLTESVTLRIQAIIQSEGACLDKTVVVYQVSEAEDSSKEMMASILGS